MTEVWSQTKFSDVLGSVKVCCYTNTSIGKIDIYITLSNKTPSHCPIKRYSAVSQHTQYMYVTCASIVALLWHEIPPSSRPTFPNVLLHFFFSNYPIRWTLKAVCIWTLWNGLNYLMLVLITIKGGERCSLLTIWWRTSSIFSKRKTSWKTHTLYFLPTMGSI